MTGQGDPRHEQIKEQRRQISRLDLQKEYRTANGCLVRALQFSYRKQKTFLFGQLKETGVQEQCIVGQVKVSSEWTMQSWNTTGEHDYNPNLNLIEYKQKELPSGADLFSNVTPGTL